MNNTQTKSEIRWMIRRDMDQVMDIEHAAFQWPNKWTENTFLAFLRQRNAIGTVITTGGCWDPIAGFMVYELYKERIELARFAIHPKYQRQGYGTQLIQRLINKLDQQRRYSFGIDIPEKNVGAQLFFSRCGLKAIPAGETVRMDYWLN
jgi:ribosomal-protein-alanine N-acetyltransferase